MSHPSRLPEPSFHELMSAHIQRAPWLGLSIILHALILFVLLLIPVDNNKPEQAPQLAIQTPEKPPDIEDPIEPPDEDPIEKPIEVDPTIPETTVLEPTENVADVSTEDFESTLTAFDSLGDNPAIGLGGSAGGSKYGGRPGGGGGRARRPFSAITDRALRWLAAHQDANGGWDADEFMKHDIEGTPCDGPGNAAHDVGVTGLALLAFLGDGHTMRSGAYRDVVKRGVLWLREQQDPDTGLIGARTSNEYVYDHAIATLAMTEAVGLSKSRLLRPDVQDALNYLEYHRNPYSAWRYQPRDGDADTSVTGWCILAYKVAQDFDFEINPSALKTADAWLASKTDPSTGRTGYIETGGRSSRHTDEHAARFPREKGECMSAVSLLCRTFLGHDPRTDPVMAKQAALISNTLPVWDEDSGAIDHYAWYYGTYALYQIGGRDWKRWSKALASAVAKTQRTEGNALGSWDPVGVWGESGGRVYSTAILCLTCQAYYRYARVIVR